jgi:ATP-binding cassette subfamily G (WHITE) protein 2 (PDR)
MSKKPKREAWKQENPCTRSQASSDPMDCGPPEVHAGWSAMEENDRRELEGIAASLTRRRSSFAGGPQHTLVGLEKILTLADDDPKLHPDRPEFDLAAWLKRCIREVEAEGKTIKRSGIVYQNLSVSGTESALQLQQTVGSILMAPLRPGEWFTFGSKERKQILQNFDGVLTSGELLVVLGRPGSGCSTLLKTMCGELNGLTVDKKSTIHYNGIPLETMRKEFRGETTYNQEVCQGCGVLSRSLVC